MTAKRKLASALPGTSGLALCLAFGLWSGTAAANSCVSCHSSPEFFAKYPSLDAYYKKWVDSTHAQAGVTCNNCHGGKPNEASQAAAHQGVLPVSDPNSRLFFRNQPQTCGRCHSEKLEQFRLSKHYRALQGTRVAPTCTTCHPAMSSRPSYRVIVLNACRNCHAEGNKAGLPAIGDKAEHALHQLNVASGFLGWSAIHFESLGWPGDSRETVAKLADDYQGAVNRVHRFDLDKTEAEASDILARLQAIFAEAKKSAEKSAHPAGAPP